MKSSNLTVKILTANDEMPLIAGETYKVNFETENHYIILCQGIWCGIYKSDAEIVEEIKEQSNGQLKFEWLGR